ncbi:LysR family transcriptional regulator [Azospirillum cavernae]|uniref:LysR family transcriptional regulator n=1 Tax=Azospirillum cavernae TaxID=2320860 RepID=A0A418VRK5_9PROT|nr:LysR family transcriptional regulator [Azospirillum cavernae]RJF79117.1 LysR family transcriptional regulator [Azospirillum cavernae]
MATLDRVSLFVEVAQHNSFTKAARKLGLSGAAVSKQIQALEEELGVKLLRRTTRHVSLTEEGAIYYERTRLALDELTAAAAEIRERRETPKGELRVNAPMSFGHMHLMPVITGFAQRYPEIQLHTVFEDRRVDVQADGYDVVIRIGTLDDSTLVARSLGDCPILPVASPAYIARHGRPTTPDDMKTHALISYVVNGGAAQWRHKGPDGRVGVFRANGHFHANTAELMLQATLDGLGIALLPIFSVDTLIKSGQLVNVLPDYHAHPMPGIFALTAPSRHRSAKVRLFIDWLQQSCRAMSWSSETAPSL